MSPDKAAVPAAAPSFDALTPLEMAQKGSLIGLKKAQTGIVPTFVLAVLAGAFIAFGAISAIGVASPARSRTCSSCRSRSW